MFRSPTTYFFARRTSVSVTRLAPCALFRRSAVYFVRAMGHKARGWPFRIVTIVMVGLHFDVISGTSAPSYHRRRIQAALTRGAAMRRRITLIAAPLAMALLTGIAAYAQQDRPA